MARTISVVLCNWCHLAISTLKDRTDLIFSPETELFAVSDRHHLDKAHMDRMVSRNPGDFHQILRIIDHRYTVDLETDLWIFQSLLHALQNFRKALSSRDLSECLFIQRIQADIDIVDPCLCQFTDLLPQKDTICRQRYFLYSRKFFEHPYQCGTVLSCQRLAAGQFYFFDPQSCHTAADSLDLIVGQDLSM